ncbi:DUF4307 domain-containing protein [Sinomonas terrae]|uniref:DUF4307 domain-containing protein n=1 Tax=Sinomonas terrae TaxID=2908838 RepID=A0ABS9U360_9MICC|nr:DUF4307 domain-containing protein [Sinomonas terrae]MCH6471141.1 DUF4307 domain-containing protein [Sinomonas terrae]
MTQSPGAAADSRYAQRGSARYGDRYGVPRRKMSRRAGLILSAAVLVVVVIGVALFAWSGNSATVSFKDVSFTTPDAGHATEDIQVTKDASQTAYCTVKAQDSSFGVVGWKQLEFGPVAGASGQTTQQAHVVLRTQTEAVSVSIDSCWIAGT